MRTLILFTSLCCISSAGFANPEGTNDRLEQQRALEQGTSVAQQAAATERRRAQFALPESAYSRTDMRSDESARSTGKLTAEQRAALRQQIIDARSEVYPRRR